MQIEIYYTKEAFKLVETFILSPNNFEKFKKLVLSLTWGDYAKGSMYSAYAIDKIKNIDCKLDATMLSRVVDNEEEEDLFNMLLHAKDAKTIQEFTKYYTDLKR